MRATEYTVGGVGPEAMPAPLPPTSGYTFAAELSIDEAIAAGAQHIDFNNPVSVYVDNFIEAPIGMDMPSGFHVEGADGRWIADPEGRVMKLVGVNGGIAELDIKGNDAGAPESPAELAALGIDAAERTQLAQLTSTPTWTTTRYTRLKDLTDSIDQGARRVVRLRDASAVDQSGAPELDCMPALIGDYKLPNWEFPVDVARKTLQRAVETGNSARQSREQMLYPYGLRD